MIQQNIDDSEYEYVLKSSYDVTLEWFYIKDNKEVKYIPKYVGEKFPNLKVFETVNCGLAIVRDYYFKNMESLLYINLFNNQITKIEPKAFDDLISVKSVNLASNLIRTLDKNLFYFMQNLDILSLGSNEITMLSPQTFMIPNGKLRHVYLESNACIDAVYKTGNSNDLNQLQLDLKANCNQMTTIV